MKLRRALKMMNKMITYSILAYLLIFSLSCDQRSPVDGDDAGGPNLNADDLMIDNNGTL